MLDPVVVDDDTLAIDAIAEVGPGGHFFGTAHTQDRYRTAFYSPLISDWRNYETGRKRAAPRPRGKANQLVEAVPRAHTSSRRWTRSSQRGAGEPSSTRRVAEGGVATLTTDAPKFVKEQNGA